MHIRQIKSRCDNIDKVKLLVLLTKIERSSWKSNDDNIIDDDDNKEKGNFNNFKVRKLTAPVGLSRVRQAMAEKWEI